MKEKYFTDAEYRILLTALYREKEVCEQVDKEIQGSQNLVSLIDSIERKIKAIQYSKEKEILTFAVKETTLLSIEEYKKYESIIPLLNDWWWLRSPGRNQNCAVYVFHDDDARKDGFDVDFNDCAVRPALKIQISNLEFFKPGNKFDLLDKRWTVLDVFEDSLYVLCDKSIGYHRFDAESNVWETSELKTWLEKQFEIKKYE